MNRPTNHKTENHIVSAAKQLKRADEELRKRKSRKPPQQQGDNTGGEKQQQAEAPRGTSPYPRGAAFPLI